jgi:GTP-binding protein
LKFRKAEFVGASATPEGHLGDGSAEVAIVGRSNVGKSSLLNRLVGSRVARVSSTPGRTRTVNWFRIDGSFWLVDLPGYGWAKASRTERESWAALVESYLVRQAGPRLILQLVDAKVGATRLDVEAAEYLADTGATMLVVATKVDRLKRNERARSLAEIRRVLRLGDGTALEAVSAVSGEGIRELGKRITDFLATG